MSLIDKIASNPITSDMISKMTTPIVVEVPESPQTSELVGKLSEVSEKFEQLTHNVNAVGAAIPQLIQRLSFLESIIECLLSSNPEIHERTQAYAQEMLRQQAENFAAQQANQDAEEQVNQDAE
jgi:hypothetical protein